MPRKITRDHAKKKQRPMVEDRVIAEHLTALLTPTITSQSRCLGARSLARETRAGVDRGDFSGLMFCFPQLIVVC